MPDESRDSRTGTRRVPESARWIAALALLLAAIAYAFLPLRHAIRGWNDFAFVYFAGRTWLHGSSPYDVVRWRAEWLAVSPSFTDAPPSQPFLYPPHFALFAVPIAMLPWSAASRLWDAVNVACTFGIVGVSVTMLRARIASPFRRAGIVAFVGLAILNGSVRYASWECQMSLLPTLGVVGAFAAARARRRGWLAVAAFVATLKPQIGFLPLLYLAISGTCEGIVWAALAALAVTIAASMSTSVSTLLANLRTDLGLHYAIGFNAPTRFTNLPALFDHRLGRIGSALAGPGVGIAATLGLGLSRRIANADSFVRRLDPMAELTLVCALVAATMPLHGYDLVVYTPLVIAAYTMRPVVVGLAIVGLVLVVGHADALAARLHVAAVAPLFTLAILGILSIEVAYMSRSSPPAPTPQA